MSKSEGMEVHMWQTRLLIPARSSLNVEWFIESTVCLKSLKRAIDGQNQWQSVYRHISERLNESLLREPQLDTHRPV